MFKVEIKLWVELWPGDVNWGGEMLDSPGDGHLSSFCPLGFQVYESKLQELQKQVETISLVAETPDEEELEEEEEEEGV